MATNIFYKMVTARYSVPSYLWALASTLLGIVLGLLLIQGDPRAVEFAVPLPFDGLVFCPLLTLGGIGAIVGMARNSPKVIRYSSLLSFAMWLGGLIAFYQSGGLENIIIFAVPMTVFWAYKYMASYVRERMENEPTV